jgi:SAM-dependent methyltransferase
MGTGHTSTINAPRVRRIFKKVVPARLVSAVRLQRARLIVEHALASGPRAPSWLEYDDLKALSHNYGFPAPYGYDPESLARRGDERAAEILRLPGAASFRNTLEFGCADGMVSAAIAKTGRKAIAVDISSERFDKRAALAGVDFRICDAAHTPVATSSVDCVFSYNSFEHVADPFAVLAETTRITRPGGILYLAFGPLYWSAFGEHAYRSIPIPYCQCLFRLETINRYCRENGRDEIDPRHVNGWSLRQYRELWDSSRASLDRVRYREGSSAGHIDLIQRYASCFRDRSTFALDFLIDDIKVVFRKK